MQLSRGLHCSVRDGDTRSGSSVARPGLSTCCHHVNSTNSSRSLPARTRPSLRMAPSPTTAAPSPSSSDQQQPGLLRWFQRWSVLSRSSTGAGSTSPQPAGQGRQQQQVRAAATTGASSSSSRPPPTHLIIMVNGLFGSAANWDVIAEQLQQQLPPDTLLHPSRVNARFSTYQGIDTCGQRLADEVRGVVAAHPSLTRLSVVAHSMGGLMARYAIGALYNPDKGLVCGLTPTHFVSMATPHCGCDADGVAQVPFIGWTGDIPLLGQQLYRFLQGISGSTASLIFQRTGQQFFLLDGTLSPSSFSPAAAAAAGGDRAAAARAAAATATSSGSSGGSGGGGSGGGSSSGQLPLLLQMSQDCPDRGLFFYSALAAFQTRTAYANMDGDHLVGFANSSLRSFDQLPPPPPQVATAKGVVLQDELSAAFWPQDWQQLQQQWSSSSSAAAQAAAAAADATEAVQAALQKHHTPSHDWTHARQQQQQQQELTAVRSSSSDGSKWRILNSVGGLGLGRSTKQQQQHQQQQQQQQQQQEDHAGSALAALELEAGGATPAATAAVAAAGAMQPPPPAAAAAAAAAAVGTSDTAASSSRSSTSRSKLLPLSYSRFRGQPGRGGAPLRTAAESAVAAAAAAPAAAAAVIDSSEEMIELQYSSPEPSSLDATQQSLSSIDYDSPSKPRQQQQQQQQPSPAAIAASGAAAVASAEADLTSGLSGQGSGPVAVAESPAEAAADVAADAAALTAGGVGGAAGSRAHVVAHMLRRLQELPWRRIDVSFQGAKFGFAHNNIQVTRRWWNFEGVAVPAHLAQQLQLMDALVVGPPSTQQQQQ